MKIYPLRHPAPYDDIKFARLCVVTDTFISIAIFVKEGILPENTGSNLNEIIEPEDFLDWVYCNSDESIITKYHNRLSSYKCKLSDINEQFADHDNYYYYLGKCILNFYDLKHMDDYALFGCGVDRGSLLPANFISKYPQTYYGKESYKDFLCDRNLFLVASFIMPTREVGLTDDHNILLIDAVQDTIFDIRSESVELMPAQAEEDYAKLIEPKRWLPTAIINGPTTIASNSVAEYAVKIRNNQYAEGKYAPTGELIDYNIKVQLDSTGGYIPLREFYVEGGQFKFSIYTDHLPEGNITLKVNAPCFTSLGHLEVSVV
jgi:hypothetical protein